MVVTNILISTENRKSKSVYSGGIQFSFPRVLTKSYPVVFETTLPLARLREKTFPLARLLLNGLGRNRLGSYSFEQCVQVWCCAIPDHHSSAMNH